MDSEPTNGKLFCVNQQHASIHQPTRHYTDIHNNNVPSLGFEQQHEELCYNTPIYRHHLKTPTGKPSRYATSHSGQRSLAIPAWVGAMSISKSWGVNRHTTRYTSAVTVISQCKLVSGWRLRKQRSVPSYGPCGLGRTFLYYIRNLPYALTSMWPSEDLFDSKRRVICSSSRQCNSSQVSCVLKIVWNHMTPTAKINWLLTAGTD